MSVVHLAWLCIIGFFGLGSMLVCISAQIDHCRIVILHALAMYMATRPPGYRAFEYYQDGTIKRVETVPDDGKDVS